MANLHLQGIHPGDTIVFRFMDGSISLCAIAEWGDRRMFTIVARKCGQPSFPRFAARAPYVLRQVTVAGCVGTGAKYHTPPAGYIPVRLVPLSEEERATVIPCLLMSGLDFTFWEGE